jgi:hypothetical protein
MTEVEYGKLVAEYGDDGTKRLIEILDNYKGASGKTYKSDYRAILNWVVTRFREERANERGGNGKSPDMSFLAEMDMKLEQQQKEAH